MVARKKKKRETNVRVLIAEDYDDLREGLLLCFQREGWTVTGAKDGREALRIYHETIQHDQYFDLLILDISMPRLNGIAVGVNVRNLEQFSEVPRAIHVYLTGHDKELTIHGDDLVAVSFADAYIRKPFEMSELIEMVTELVSKQGEVAP